jgi:hypothetical protein
LHVGLGEEREQVLALVGEVPKQPAVRRVRWAHRKQLVGPLAKLGDAHAELLGVEDILVALIAQRERVLEDPAGGVRNARLPRHRIRDQLPGPSEQVRCTGLMLGGCEPSIGRPSIALQDTRVARAEDLLASSYPRPAAIRYTVTFSPANAHSHAFCPLIRHPVSSGATARLARTPSISASYVGSSARAWRAIAWTTPPAVTRIPNLSSARAVFCGDSPRSLFSSVAKATARGPSMHAAAPRASEV